MVGQAGEQLAVVAFFTTLRTRPSTSSEAQIWQLPLRQLCGHS